MQQFNLILSTTLAVFAHWWKNWEDQEGGHPTPLNNHNVHSKLVLAEGLYKTSIYHQMRKWMEDKKIYLGHWSRTSFLTIFWFVLKASYIHVMKHFFKARWWVIQWTPIVPQAMFVGTWSQKLLMLCILAKAMIVAHFVVMIVTYNFGNDCTTICSTLHCIGFSLNCIFTFCIHSQHWLCVATQGRSKWNETPHKSWECSFSWTITANIARGTITITRRTIIITRGTIIINRGTLVLEHHQ